MTNGIIGLRKRITATVLSLVIAFGSLPVISAFAESDEAFKGFSYWSVSGGELSAVSGISGYGAGISQNSGNAAKLTSELISVKSGRKYKAGVSVSSSAANADAELTVAFFGDEEGENAVGETLSLEKSSPTADFGEISGDFTPPEGAAYARLIVSLGENGKSGDEYKLDNAYLYIYGTAAPIYADEAVPGYSAGEWARYPDGNGKKWENTASRYIETVDDGCGGDGALHIVNTGIEGDMWLTVVPDSVPAGSYTVRMKVKGSVTAPGQTFRFADSAHIDSGVGNLFADRVSYDDWTDFSYDYESDGTNRFFFVFSQYNGLSDVYIDSLKVVNKETGKDILNGKGDFCLDGGYNLVASNNLAKNGDFEDIVYTYLSPDKFNGNFDGAEVKEEPLKWTLNDNYTGDTLVLSSDSSHGGVLEMTKGASASAGAGWVTLSSPNISVEQGTKYRFSADLKGIGSNPYYIITAYWFFDNGTAPVQVKPAGGEGNLSDGWNTVAADLEAPQNAKEIQLRIVFQGAAGDKMLFDNASLCPLGMSASLDGWQEAGYSSPDPESCYVRLEDNGNADAGSVHIYQDYEKNTAHARAGISYMLKGLENGKTYVMELWLKGATQTAGDPLAAELYWGLGNWAKSGNGGLLFDNVNYSEWTKMSYEFTVTNAQWAPLCISPGGYAGVDCYIDNVAVYDKSDTAQTNLISNGGFYSYSQPDTSRQLIQNGDFENMRVLSAPGWSFSGKTDYDKASSIISLGDNSAAGAKLLFDNISVVYLGDSTDPNLDFESGENGEKVFNWNMYERRENPNKPGEFEEGSFGAYTAVKAEGASKDGSAAVHISKPQAGDVQLYLQSIMLEVGGNTDYLLSYDAMAQGNKKGSLQICVRQYKNAYGDNVKDEAEAFKWVTDAYEYGSFDWKSCGGAFKTAKDAKFVKIWLVSNTSDAMDMYIDNVALTKTESIDDPNLDFEYTAGGKPLNWSYVTSDGIASISADKSVYYRGSSSLHIEKQYSRINYTTATMAKRINVNAGDRIEFVIHMRSRNAVSGAFAASLSGYNSSGTLIQSWTGQDRPLNSGSSLSDWQEYRIVYTVPKNVRSVALAMRIGGRKADVYFDSIEYYNYTESNDTVYAEDFASPSSDGMFGGFKKTDVKGNPSFGTAGEAIISGGLGDSAAIEKKIDIINTDYSYQFTAHYRTTGTAVGKLSLTGYNWKNESVGAVVDREISSAPTSTEIKVDFTAINAAYYVLRFEKTGGDGGVALNDVTVHTTAEPSVDLGWEGAWIVHPADYDTIESQKNNERYYYYRQEINLESTVKSAQMQITADDRADVYINGEKVYEETRTGDTWSLPVTLDITEYLQKGKNVIAVRLYNGVYRYALLYDGIVKMDNDSVLRFYTDESVNVARESIGENSTPNPQWSESDADNFMKPDYDMSTGGWTKAEIYANVGSGGWGAIDFDFSEYSDYKIETNEFTFPKNTIYAGDTVTVTATLKIAEKLPEASSFKIYFWKRNSTSRICTGTITLANGKTTKSWPTGKEFTAEFEITVPQFLAAGDYTVQFDNTVAIVSDYYINNKVGSLKIAQYKQEVSTKSEIKMYNGKPTVFVNGVAQAPLWYSRPERDTQFDQSEMEGLASVGIDTSIAFILPRETLGELWMSDGTIKTETIDQQILGTLAANPNSQLVMAIDTTPPQWWLDAHPEECVKLNDGTVSKESFSSELWKKETGEKVTEIINYLMQQPYANNIIGFKITGGTTYEWQWWGINGSTKAGDYSSVGLTAFRAWLKERYKTDAALKSAWGDSSVTLATAAVPSIAVRSETELGSILSAGKNRQAIDYELFMGEKKTEAMLYFASLVKKATNNRLFVGTYAGYLLNVINYDMAASTSQTSFQKILESDSIDFITCPWNYSEREIGYSGDYMSAVDSVTAHGKLYIAEDDNRNHTTSMFEAPDARASVGWTRTAEQSIEQLKRNFAYALSKGCGLYLYSLAGTYFTDKQLWETASAMMQEMTLSLGLERKSVSDIAVFYDEQSPAYMPYSGSDLTNELLYKGLLLTQRKELYNLGAPYDTYLLDDLEKGLVPEHKINIMLSTTQVTEAERRAISEKLQKNGNVIIWVFTSGMSDGNTTSVDNLSALTGMNMKLIESPNTERKLMGTVEVENYNSWVTEGLADVSFGAIEYRTLAPVIAVDDETAVTLGYHTEQNGYGTNNVGFAMKEMTDGKGNSWTSIYSAVPCIPADILRNVLKHCGCHIYDDTATDIIYADNNYISVHSLFGGEKTVTLQGNYTVYDVFNRKVIAKSVNSFTYSSDKGETRLFRISKNDKIKLYFTRTAGGTVSPEGLNEAEYGGKVTLTFKPNSGYRLGYLLIDGVKTTVNGSSYTFNNIKESHTVAVYYTRLYEKLPLDDNDDPVDPTVPDNGGNNNGHIEPVTPDVNPDNGGTDDDDGRQAITKKNTRYYTTVSLNLPVIIALCAAALAVLAAIVILLIVLLGKNIYFTRNGRRIYSAKIKRGTVRLDKLKEKQGLEGITATVKKGYAAHHAGQSVNLSLNGAPHTSITLEKGGNNSAEL